MTPLIAYVPLIEMIESQNSSTTKTTQGRFRYSLRTLFVALTLVSLLAAIIANRKQLAFAIMDWRPGRFVVEVRNGGNNVIDATVYCSSNIGASIDVVNLRGSALVRSIDAIDSENIAESVRISGNRTAALRITWDKSDVVISNRRTGRPLVTFTLAGDITNVSIPNDRGSGYIGPHTGLGHQVAIFKLSTRDDSSGTLQLPVNVGFERLNPEERN